MALMDMDDVERAILEVVVEEEEEEEEEKLLSLKPRPMGKRGHLR